MRFYLDSMVWIYAIEANPQFGPTAQDLLRKIRASGHTLLTSHMLLAELLVAPARKDDTATVAAYRRMLTGPGVEVVPFTAEVAVRFGYIRAQFRTQPADSIHLALAANAGADKFVSGDILLSRIAVPGIGQIVDLNYQVP